jgi:hypothetical protein
MPREWSGAFVRREEASQVGSAFFAIDTSVTCFSTSTSTVKNYPQNSDLQARRTTTMAWTFAREVAGSIVVRPLPSDLMIGGHGNPKSGARILARRRRR